MLIWELSHTLNNFFLSHPSELRMEDLGSVQRCDTRRLCGMLIWELSHIKPISSSLTPLNLGLGQCRGVTPVILLISALFEH